MRTARIFGDPGAPVSYYHCMARIIEGRYVFEDKQVASKLVELIEAYFRTTGVEVLTWTVLSNHFHVLLAVPSAEQARAKLGDEEIIERLGHIYGEQAMREVRWQFKNMRENGGESGIEKLRERYLSRMFDLSSFMGGIKQCLTQWYNRRVGRKGPLWEDRFKSVLVEGDGRTLMTMAAYIDLNAVRAGLVDDPKDWRNCGYARAVVGDKPARAGIAKALGDVIGEASADDWRQVHRAYRTILMEGARERVDEEGKVVRRGIPPSQADKRVKEAFESAGGLSPVAVLGCRVRYFIDGLAIGRQAFIEEVFARNRERMGVKREEGARKPRDIDLGPLRTLRDLRGKVTGK